MDHAEQTYHVLPNVLIPMRDGVRLAARIYLPVAQASVPAIVSLMPYHKDGSYSVGYLESVHKYLASRGYATLAVDLRGVGNSEGDAAYAFAPGERDDGYDLVEWAAGQPWCSGAVGMWGLSYSGITALSTASTRPPSLKAIVAIHAATDLYWDYLAPHGCRSSFSPNVHWGIRMAASNLLPPLYDGQDGDWDTVWQQRLQSYRPWILGWHEHPAYDEYWQKGATLPNQIEAATWIVGGWRDLFADVDFRVFDQLTCPKRLLVGPWKHIFPDLAAQAPIGFLPELERWWAYWLNGESNGVEHDPPITHYVYGADEWRYEHQWPPATSKETSYALTNERTLTSQDEKIELEDPLVYQANALVGFDTIAMHWLPGPDEPVYPPSDDAASVCFELGPSDDAFEIIGTPVVSLRLNSSIPAPPVVARLFSVEPSGSARLITLGWVKSEDRDRKTFRNRSIDDETFEVRVPLRPIAYRVASGSKLRLTISCADISRIWPEPRHFSIALHSLTFTLPTGIGRDPSLPIPHPHPPMMAPSSRTFSRVRRLQVTRDTLEPIGRLETTTGQSYYLDDGSLLDADLDGRLMIDGARPWRSSLYARASCTLRRSSGTVRTEATMIETAARLQVTTTVTRDGTTIYAKEWQCSLSDWVTPVHEHEEDQLTAASQTRR